MLHIKAHYPASKFEAAFFSFFPALWVPPQYDISKPTNLHVSMYLTSHFWRPSNIAYLDRPRAELYFIPGGRDNRWCWDTRI